MIIFSDNNKMLSSIFVGLKNHNCFFNLRFVCLHFFLFLLIATKRVSMFGYFFKLYFHFILGDAVLGKKFNIYVWKKNLNLGSVSKHITILKKKKILDNKTVNQN